MKYTVVWRPTALQRLADLYNNAADRQSVTSAANHIDKLLGRDPLAQGESRGGPTRILLIEPLGVYYDVSEDDRLVTVWAVWRRG